MFSKTKLLEIYEKIVAHSKKSNDAELEALAQELHSSIQAMDATNDSGGGNSPSDPPPIP